MSYAEREKAAQAIHAANIPEPAGQKFPCGSKVRIADGSFPGRA